MELLTIRKYNNIYDKIICDPGVAYEIADRFTFDIPGAKFTPAFKNKVWDGKIRLFNPLSSLLYCGLRQELETLCSSRGYSIEYDGIEGDTEFSVFEANEFVSKLNPKYIPRDYQMVAFIHGVRKKRSLFLSPTSSGKSLMIYLLTCWYAKKTLIIVPTVNLVHQMTSDFEDYGFPIDSIHKIVSGKEKDSNKMIFCSTWQSIYKMPNKWFQQFNVVIGDEAHLFKAKSLTTIMKNLEQCEHRFAFTGTLDGTETNKLVIEGLFGAVKIVTTTSQLMKDKHVADLKIKSIVLRYPDDIRKIMCKTDYPTEVEWLVLNERRNIFIKNLALSLEGNTLLLYQFVEKHGKVLYEMIKQTIKERNVYFISGKVDGEKREEIRKIIETEQNAIIVASSGTTATGINIKNLHNVIFSSPSKSRVKVLQSIGRILRTSDTKSEATLYDIADDLSWKTKKNYTLLHYMERIKTYNIK
jgi:superfamily II DNA or RNA helicase